MPEPRHARGLIDTSVVIDAGEIDRDLLPAQLLMSTITLAELAVGPYAAGDEPERARRQEQLQRAEATFDPLPVDTAAARAYGRVFAAVSVVGCKPRGRRALDLLIAATAVAAELPLYTRNPADFAGLDELVEVVGI